MIQRLILCFALALVSACVSGKKPAQWIDATLTAPSDSILWDVTRLSLQKTGFPLGTGLERGKLLAVSGWHTSLAPFKGDGFRERAHIEYVPQGDRKYGVKVRVEREINQDITHPLDLSYAEWESDRDNVTRAQIVLGYVRAMLETKSTPK
ncbi:MAG: hypothetical protein SGI72_08245 [Planctomycetota bacterium]|nr:hypothetical protein [Planctomycetota bacterium]